MPNTQLIAAQSVPLPPSLIATAGNKASLRFIEFFAVNIRNSNTRAAYARAAADFLGWREGRGIDALGRVRPAHVAAYIELLQGKRAAPTVKQHLACIRMMFNWLVIGKVMPANPAHSDQGPRHSVTKAETGAVVGRIDDAAHRHGCFSRRRSARPRHHCGLFLAEKTLVASASRKKR